MAASFVEKCNSNGKRTRCRDRVEKSLGAREREIVIEKERGRGKRAGREREREIVKEYNDTPSVKCVLFK